MKINEKIFIGIVANVVIIVLIAAVSMLTVLPRNYVPSWAVASDDIYYRGNAENNNVSLMFNVYWGSDEVKEILNILEEKEVKVTFFLGGTWADKNNALVLAMHEAGHELGNHGYFHKDHTKINREQNYQEIDLTNKLIETVSGVKPKLFAPPSGAYNKTTVSVCKELDQKVIMWSKDTIDWRDKDEQICYNRAVKNAQNGDLILMHPMAHTVKVLSKIIDFYLEKGYNITTVSENIAV